jgi:hypothetical protein
MEYEDAMLVYTDRTQCEIMSQMAETWVGIPACGCWIFMLVNLVGL